MNPKIIYLIKKLVFSILLFLSFLNIKAQTKKINLDSDFGFEFAKLGENYFDVTKRIELYPFSCNYCEAKDSIAKKYSIKSLDKVQIEGITTDRICNFYFIDNLLYKIEISLPNNDLVQQKLTKFFTEKYGKEDEKNGVIKIWETKNTYLEVYIPNVVNQDNKFSSITIFSKELNEKLNKRLKEGNDKKPEIVSLKNERKGKGNSSFTPDIINSLNLLQKNSTRKNLESLLPNYKVIDTLSLNYRYNEKTNERDIYDGLVSKYSFMYKDEFMVFLEVTTKKGIITRFEYGFDFAQNLDKIKNQVIKNGFVFDSRLTKVFIKLGFNYCLVFTKKPNYNFTIYHKKKFTVSKS